MPNVFQHAVGLASFAYTMTLLISYLIVMACTLSVCNLLSTVLSDKMVHLVKRVVSSCANGVFKYFALQPSCEYLNDTCENMRHYKHKQIKSIRLYYRRVPKKLLNLYNKMSLCRMQHLVSEMTAECTKSDHCMTPMSDYLHQHAETLPFHCGLLFEMEDGAHLMLDKTSTLTLIKLKDPHIKHAVMKDISLGDGVLKRCFTLGAFIDAGKRRMKDTHWFQWDFKHNCFYVTKRLLVKNGLYSEEAHEMTRYYAQMQRLHDASKTFSYSKNLELFVQLQARTVACNLDFVNKINRIIMYSFN
jgi:hypothetical protein